MFTVHGEFKQVSCILEIDLIYSGPWDLEVSSNVYSSEAAIQNPHLLPPHPDIELQRSQLIAKLRQCYQQSCQSREGIDAPKESLNRYELGTIHYNVNLFRCPRS